MKETVIAILFIVGLVAVLFVLFGVNFSLNHSSGIIATSQSGLSGLVTVVCVVAVFFVIGIFGIIIAKGM
ncbi:MAG: hypothetical protein P8X87_03570 [Candidatus Bathyarchaeota archaeon]